jgi:hypothetical protein
VQLALIMPLMQAVRMAQVTQRSPLRRQNGVISTIGASAVPRRGKDSPDTVGALKARLDSVTIGPDASPRRSAEKAPPLYAGSSYGGG